MLYAYLRSLIMKSNIVIIIFIHRQHGNTKKDSIYNIQDSSLYAIILKNVGLVT